MTRIRSIEDARPAEARKAENSERADVKVTETRLQPPDQRCVGKATVQIHWRLGSDHRMVEVGYGVMQKAQRRIVVPPPAIGHAARHHVTHPARHGNELRYLASPHRPSPTTTTATGD